MKKLNYKIINLILLFLSLQVFFENKVELILLIERELAGLANDERCLF